MEEDGRSRPRLDGAPWPMKEEEVELLNAALELGDDATVAKVPHELCAMGTRTGGESGAPSAAVAFRGSADVVVNFASGAFCRRWLREMTVPAEASATAAKSTAPPQAMP